MEQTKQNTVLQTVIVGLKLLLICAIIAGVVSFVYALTEEPYLANQKAQKADAIGAIFGVPDGSLSLKPMGDGETVNAVLSADGKLIGYSVEVVESTGYNGDITMIIGYTAMGKVSDVKIISHSETPGLGSKVDSPDYLDQFKGTTDQLDYSEVDGISGATYSSKAVMNGINQATKALHDAFGKEASK